MRSLSCRVRLSEHAKRQLWSESAGYCQNPACRNYLFAEEADVDFAEMAHVIPASPGGPRDLPINEVSLQARASPENIVVLCANCHTVVDKAPGLYAAEVMLEWKRRHIELLRTMFGTPQFDSRAEARRYIEPLMDANHAVHVQYGPTGDPYVMGNPELWQKHALTTIIPNNREIQRVLNANRHLLTDAEKQTVALFNLHIEQFERRHVLGDWTAGTERFPDAMQTVLMSSQRSHEE
jgi:hypothetical protein